MIELISFLKLPDNARVNQRVPKKLLLDQCTPTATDKRRLQEGIEELVWVAALKPSNIGVPAFQDENRNYLEIHILTVGLRSGAKAARIVELIHRTIPYPVALVAGQEDGVTFSLAHKRFSQAEVGQMVVERVEMTGPILSGSRSDAETAFLSGLALAEQPKQNLFALYQGWIDHVAALAAARITGTYRQAETPEQAATRRTALDEHAALEREIIGLRTQAEKEKQVPRLVDLNMEINRLEALLAATMKEL